MNAALEYEEKNIRTNCGRAGLAAQRCQRGLDKGLIAAHQMIAIELVDRVGKPEEISEVVL